MPGKDKTGPQGYGPGTGRGGGGCAEGVSAKNVMGTGRGMRNGNLGNRGNRGGGGRRRRWSCNGFVEPAYTPDTRYEADDMNQMETEKNSLEDRLSYLHKKIANLRNKENVEEKK